MLAEFIGLLNLLAIGGLALYLIQCLTDINEFLWISKLKLDDHETRLKALEKRVEELENDE